MGYASREQNYKICLRPCAAGSEGHIFARIQLHPPNNIAPAVIGGGAIFVGMRILVHGQKEPRERKS